MLQAWLILMILLFALPLVVGVALPEAKIIIGALLILSIYSFVRQFFGDGLISLILTGAAAYYLVYKHFWVTTALWWVHLVLVTFAFSAVGWTFIVVSKFFRGRKA